MCTLTYHTSSLLGALVPHTVINVSVTHSTIVPILTVALEPTSLVLQDRNVLSDETLRLLHIELRAFVLASLKHA